MEQDPDERRTTDPNGATQTEINPTPKKPYAPPVLVEYGTIAKLTQGSRTRFNDGINTRKRRTCL